MDNKAEKAPEQIVVPIRWNVPDSIITRYASNMTIQVVEHEFRILFFELKPEIRTDSSQPLQTEVRADCVASIIVNPKKLPGFIKVLQQQVDQYQAKQLKEEPGIA